ncbi:hypothetical protein NECAME_05046 [Necator americanus]|uniref:Uncharacterized protein n=1 Tax=Necator americanus TaxID=51031 RepID=W2SKA3_NECAM|nr:hypothetical protein NECAME_05046 [Necator americanus]ETN69988.1 hypothetical protein NECAME_05046 [Necator americanus]
MTRKRKVDNSGDEGEVRKPNGLGEYGYQSAPVVEASPSSGCTQQNPTFPRKGSRGDYWENEADSNHSFPTKRSRHFGGSDFRKNSGHYEGDEEMSRSRTVPETETDNSREDEGTFPSELVAYLKSIEQMKQQEGHIG